MLARLGWAPGLTEDQTAGPEALVKTMGTLPERDLESDWDPRPRTYRLDGPHIADPRLSFLIAALDFLTRRNATDGIVLVSTGTAGPSYAPALAVLAGAFPGLTWTVHGAAAPPGLASLASHTAAAKTDDLGPLRRPANRRAAARSMSSSITGGTSLTAPTAFGRSSPSHRRRRRSGA